MGPKDRVLVDPYRKYVEDRNLSFLPSAETWLGCRQLFGSSHSPHPNQGETIITPRSPKDPSSRAPQGCWGLVKHPTFTGLAVCSKLVTCMTATVGKAPECLAYVHTATIAILTRVSPCIAKPEGCRQREEMGGVWTLTDAGFLLSAGIPLCSSLCHGPPVVGSSGFPQEDLIVKARIPRLY